MGHRQVLGLRTKGQGRRRGSWPRVHRDPTSPGPLGNAQTRASTTLGGYQLDRAPGFEEFNSSPAAASQEIKAAGFPRYATSAPSSTFQTSQSSICSPGVGANPQGDVSLIGKARSWSSQGVRVIEWREPQISLPLVRNVCFLFLPRRMF